MSVVLLSLLASVVAVFASLWARRPLALRLGKAWLTRFLLIQGVAINAVLFLIIKAIVDSSGMAPGTSLWVMPIGYGVLFYFYSLSNIDWTAQKFHGEED